MVFSISRWKGGGKRWERWLSKFDLKWGKHCCCCWFGQKWLLNRIKHGSRIFEHPQDCNSLDSERGFGKQKVVCTFCSTLLDTWAKGRSSHILPRHYRDGRYRQKFLKQNYYGIWDLVFCLCPETKPQSSEWVGETSPRLKKLKFQRYRIKTMLIIFFDSQGIVHKEFILEGKTVKTEFYKGVTDRLLKHIHRVRPAVFCSWDFFLLHSNSPTHKVASVCQFLTQKMLQPFITPPYCPNLSPSDYFLFPRLKMKLKGVHFAVVVEIQEAVTDVLKRVQNEKAFQKLQPCKSLCICQLSLFWIKKVCVFLTCLRFKKKISSKTFGLHCICTYEPSMKLCSALHVVFSGPFGSCKTWLLTLSCPSIHLNRTRKLPLDRFPWNIILETFIKISVANSSLAKIGQKY